LLRELVELNPTFSKVSQLVQGLFEFKLLHIRGGQASSRCLEALLVTLLPCLDLSLESPFDDLFPHMLDAAYKKRLELALLNCAHSVAILFLLNTLLPSLEFSLELSDFVCVIGLQDLDVVPGLLFHLLGCEL